MTVTADKNRHRQDLSLLAIDAAEELERLRRKLSTDLRAVNALSILLQESFTQKVNDPNFNLRLDHASVFSSAIENSSGLPATKKTVSDVAHEAIQIASRLNLKEIDSKDDDLKKLISFCVALSDSAALYREEFEELKKHFA